jgi:hypothetical protein
MLQFKKELVRFFRRYYRFIMSAIFTVALFGEAERGAYDTIYQFSSLQQLVENLGHPPADSYGLYYAVQALMCHYQLLFFRVREEGFSSSDYLNGLHLLRQVEVQPKIGAICIPGVGSAGIIDATLQLCIALHCVVVTTEADLYDYFTER